VLEDAMEAIGHHVGSRSRQYPSPRQSDFIGEGCHEALAFQLLPCLSKYIPGKG